MSQGVNRLLFWGSMVVLCLGCTSFGQTAPSPTPTPSASRTIHKPESNFIKDIASDQKAIWTSPFHIRRSDRKWLAPFGFISAGLIASDQETSEWIGRGGSLPGVSRKVSWNGALYTTGAVAGGMYLFGRWTHNDRLRETGRLAAESLVDSQVVTQASKVIFGRLRPNEGDSEGRFFHGGRSFFSGHASGSWSVATVIACEYHDRPLAVIAAYGLASAVSLARYTARKHYLGDVFVGVAVGYGIGRYVCGKRASYAADDDPGSTTFARRWSVAPYIDPYSGAKGGSLRWAF